MDEHKGPLYSSILKIVNLVKPIVVTMKPAETQGRGEEDCGSNFGFSNVKREGECDSGTYLEDIYSPIKPNGVVLEL